MVISGVTSHDSRLSLPVASKTIVTVLMPPSRKVSTGLALALFIHANSDILTTLSRLSRASLSVWFLDRTGHNSCSHPKLGGRYGPSIS